ncbi:MAG: cupin [Gammaproteobacteria bacterium CG11_big_fil_rev_8_21_14_0_20_46_22]|nr:MAG: cupin [Gammaproteobacteria bacterium CG12_big_fil_rev_8_21_14_0_65_46_12]PIR11898.1 MAG: cupin [Gammaproteobacteria bacterium CG11_big_fil_rev_8_21_14_0_20_46_22]
MSDNIFDNLPKRVLPKEVFETLHQNKHLKLERILSTGQTSDWYDQAQDEWVILLQGHATLVFEGGKAVNLKPGDYLFIEAHRKHRVSWTNPDEVCVWLALYIPVQNNSASSQML